MKTNYDKLKQVFKNELNKELENDSTFINAMLTIKDLKDTEFLLDVTYRTFIKLNSIARINLNYKAEDSTSMLDFIE